MMDARIQQLLQRVRKLREKIEKIDKEFKPRESFDDPLAEMLRCNGWKPVEAETEPEESEADVRAE